MINIHTGTQKLGNEQKIRVNLMLEKLGNSDDTEAWHELFTHEHWMADETGIHDEAVTKTMMLEMKRIVYAWKSQVSPMSNIDIAFLEFIQRYRPENKIGVCTIFHQLWTIAVAASEDQLVSDFVKFIRYRHWESRVLSAIFFAFSVTNSTVATEEEYDIKAWNNSDNV